MNLHGVFVASITPFDPTGKVDYEALEAHLLRLKAAGVQGFVPCGTTGEVATLSDEEWREIIRTTRKVARLEKGLRVIAGCGGNCTWKSLERIREAKDLGCDAALVVTPYYNKPTPGGQIAHFEHLADHGGLPLILYNVPSRTNVHLSVETVARLFRHPNIVGLKEASGQYAHWLALASEVDLQNKALLAGDDDSFALILALGGTGIISASANVTPANFVQIFRHATEGRLDQAFQLQKRLNPLIRALFLETNPAPAKEALSILGHIKPWLRLPLVPVKDETKKIIKTALETLEIA